MHPAELTGVTRKTVRKYLAELEQRNKVRRDGNSYQLGTLINSETGEVDITPEQVARREALRLEHAADRAAQKADTAAWKRGEAQNERDWYFWDIAAKDYRDAEQRARAQLERVRQWRKARQRWETQGASA